MNLKGILVPVDFTENSVIAACHASRLARRFHSDVTLLYVNEMPVTDTVSMGDPTRAEQLAQRQTELNEFGCLELRGLSVKRVVRCGDPAKVIVEHSLAESTDLILMPTHGRGVFRRFLLGSVTAKVLHDADCPVWTGAHLAGPATSVPTEVRHVMCAVDFGPQTKKAIRWAADFASELGAKLTVVHAMLAMPPNLPDRYVYQWRGESQMGAGERLRCLLAECAAECSLGAKVQAETLLVNGDVPATLGAAARQMDAELLVTARSCAPGWVGRLGAKAYGIICHSPCPVVSI